MANFKVSELPSTTSVADDDVVMVIQQGHNKRATIAQMNAAAVALVSDTVVSGLTSRVTTLENIQYEYEVFASIASGTSGTITYPTGSTLVVGEYAGQNAIVTALDANGRPIDQAARTAAGAVITATLGVGGSYTLSGAPSAYPVGLVYQVRCAAKDAGNVSLTSVIDATQVEGTMAKQDANAVAITGGTASVSSLTLPSGTANGVVYLNASKAATSGAGFVFDGTNLGIGTSSPAYKLDVSGPVIRLNNSDATADIFLTDSGTTNGFVRLRGESNALKFITGNGVSATLDASGNLGLGVTPSAWATYKAMQTGWSALAGYAGADTAVFSNAFFDGSYKYIGNGFASQYRQINSTHQWFTAPSGTAGSAISFTQAMTLDASGNLLVGGTANPYAVANRGIIQSNGTSSAMFGLGVGGVAAGYWISDGSQMTIGAPAGNPILFDINGERMRLDSSGNLGIGTSSPGSKLDVVGVARASTRFVAPAFWGSGTGVTEFMDSLGTTGMYVTGAGASPSNSIRFFSAGSTLATLDSSGNLGIGTGSPVQKLHVVGNIRTTNSLIEDTGTGVNFGTITAGYLAFLSGSGAERMRLNSSGNLGIGTDSPAYPLVVNAAASSQIQIRAGNTSDSALIFGDTDAPAIGRIVYAHANDSMTFLVNGSNRATIDSAGNLLITSTTGAMGYGAGTGGSVTQTTSRTTGVTLDRANGSITLFSAAGNTSTPTSFTVTNSLVGVNDVVYVSQRSGTNSYRFDVTATAAGSFTITFLSIAGTAVDAPVLNFVVIKGPTT